MTRILKHDEYVEELISRLQGRYDTLYRSLPLYSSKGRLVAEVDLVGVGPHGVDIFEVKCSRRVVKARRQLQKIRKLFGQGLDECINTWMYCGEAGQLVQLS